MKKTSLILIAVVIASVTSTSRAQTIEKELQYDRHTLADTFQYGKIERHFQWDKVREMLQRVEQMQSRRAEWGVLQNKADIHGRAPLVRESHTDEYNRAADRNGVQQYQGIPFYAVSDTDTPEIYGRDGSPVRIVSTDPNSEDRMIVEAVNFGGTWSVPDKYIKRIGDSVDFNRVVMVDRTMQTILTVERVGDKWLVRSMNPSTTGRHHPPFEQPTPLGIYVIQEKKPKMFYTNNGSSVIAGYAPWASRFCGGGYVHGIPLNGVNAKPIEFSRTLGTTPRSHMCVRNATSHAEFVYNWAPVCNSLVTVIE